MGNWRRWAGWAAAICVAVGPEAAAQQSPAAPSTRFVVVDGRRVRVQIAGLENRKPGSPVIVLESGAMNSSDVWASIIPQAAAVAPVVAYDRAGLGQSGWDEKTPTPRHVTERLRRILQEVGGSPPYLLVGWSWGGALARYFAGYYPADVTGIVYVDPGPIITQSPADELAPFHAIGAGRAGYDAFWSGYAAHVQRASPAARAEFEVYRGLMRRDASDRDLLPAPAVPVVVIVAAKPYPALPGLPYDAQGHFDADLRQRIRSLQEWALASPHGTLVVSNHTTHAVLRDDPELVLWAIRRVLLAPATPR